MVSIGHVLPSFGTLSRTVVRSADGSKARSMPTLLMQPALDTCNKAADKTKERPTLKLLVERRKIGRRDVPIIQCGTEPLNVRDTGDITDMLSKLPKGGGVLIGNANSKKTNFWEVLEAGKNLVGAVNVNNSLVSRSHFTITWNGKAYYVKDLGSTHGTKVCDKKIEKLKFKRVQPHEWISDGQDCLTFVVPQHSLAV